MYIGTMEFSGNVLRMTDDPIIRPTTPEKVAAGIEAPTCSLSPKGGRSTYNLLGLKRNLSIGEGLGLCLYIHNGRKYVAR